MRSVCAVGVVVAAVAAAACSPKEDVTPAIAISPGAKERIMVMDRFRHHGAPRRFLPKVTVEEVDLPGEEDSSSAPADGAPSEAGSAEANGPDGGPHE